MTSHRCPRTVAESSTTSTRTLVPPAAMPSPRELPDAAQELGLVELALDDVALGAHLLPAAPIVGGGARGDQDGGHVAQRRIAAGPFDEGEPVHARHLDVDEEQRVALAARALH